MKKCVHKNACTFAKSFIFNTSGNTSGANPQEDRKANHKEFILLNYQGKNS